MKKYLINGKNFELKEKYSIGDLDELNEIGKVLFPSSETVIEGSYTRGTLQRFCKLVLKSEESIPDEFYSEIDEDVFAKIYGDFFLSRIGLNRNTKNSFKSLMKKSNLRVKKQNH